MSKLLKKLFQTKECKNIIYEILPWLVGRKIKNQQFDNQCVIEVEFRKNFEEQVVARLEKIDEIEFQRIL